MKMKRTVRAMVEAFNEGRMEDFERLHAQAIQEAQHFAGYVIDKINETARNLKEGRKVNV
jgi:hypothetical protein